MADAARTDRALWRSVRGLPEFRRLLELRLVSQFGDGLFAGRPGGRDPVQPRARRDAVGDRRFVRRAVPALLAARSVRRCAAGPLGPAAGAGRREPRPAAAGARRRRTARGRRRRPADPVRRVDRQRLHPIRLVRPVGGAAARGAAGAGRDDELGRDRDRAARRRSSAPSSCCVPRWLFGADDTGAAAIIFIVAVPVALALWLSCALPAALARARTTACGRSTGRWPTRWPPAGCTASARSSAVPTVAATLAGLAAHRMVFGINTPAGAGDRAAHRHPGGRRASAPRWCSSRAAGAGSFLATVVTPAAVRRWGRYATANGALAFAAVVQLAASGLQLPVMVVCGFLLGAAGQVVKLCADSAMQLDVDDALRGHVFTVQDSLFWMSFIVAITLAASVIPADGHEPGAGARGRRRVPRRAGGARRRRPARADTGLR